MPPQQVACIFLVAGIFGTVVSAIALPTQVMVGASGAIFGVVGALWADLGCEPRPFAPNVHRDDFHRCVVAVVVVG